MTPKLRLSEDDRNTLLSWILKLRFPGIRRMMRSTQMILEPTTQARRQLGSRPYQYIDSKLTYAAYAGHDPSSSIIVEHHFKTSPRVPRYLNAQ